MKTSVTGPIVLLANNKSSALIYRMKHELGGMMQMLDMMPVPERDIYNYLFNLSQVRDNGLITDAMRLKQIAHECKGDVRNAVLLAASRAIDGMAACAASQTAMGDCFKQTAALLNMRGGRTNSSRVLDWVPSISHDDAWRVLAADDRLHSMVSRAVYTALSTALCIARGGLRANRNVVDMCKVALQLENGGVRPAVEKVAAGGGGGSGTGKFAALFEKRGTPTAAEVANKPPSQSLPLSKLARMLGVGSAAAAAPTLTSSSSSSTAVATTTAAPGAAKQLAFRGSMPSVVAWDAECARRAGEFAAALSDAVTMWPSDYMHTV